MLTLIVIFLYLKTQAEIASRLESNSSLKNTKNIFFISDGSYFKRLTGNMLTMKIKDKYILLSTILIDIFIFYFLIN